MQQVSRVIINADDFGLSDSINQSIITAYERGGLTSTTLLVRREATDAAVELAKAHPNLRVGLHLDLDRFFCFERNGHFGISVDDIDRAVYDYVVKHQLSDVRREIASQIETIFRFGLQPTHLDGHHNIHLMPHILSEVVALMRDFALNRIRFSRKFYDCHSDVYVALRRALDDADILYPELCIEIDEYLPMGEVFWNLGEGISEVIVHTDLPGLPENQWRVEQFEYISSPDACEQINGLNVLRISYAELNPHTGRVE